MFSYPGSPQVLERTLRCQDDQIRFRAIAWQELLSGLPVDDDFRRWLSEKRGLSECLPETATIWGDDASEQIRFITPPNHPVAALRILHISWIFEPGGPPSRRASAWSR